MGESTLFDAVSKLANLTHAFSDADLDQPWQWRAHDEGARFALLGTYHELRDLAVSLAQTRAKEGPETTAAHRALGQYHAAYRDLQAVLIGAGDDLYDQTPAAGEWPLRSVIGHIASAERNFFTLVHYGLRRQREDPALSTRVPEDETDKVVGPNANFRHIMDTQQMGQMLAFYDDLHQRALREFATISDQELAGPSLWWEDEEYSLQYRLHRFDAHLRQHTIQVEKTLAAVAGPANEVKRLLRLIYQALADVENMTVGHADLELSARAALADTIATRASDVAQTVAHAREMADAVAAGSLDRVKVILKETPAAVNSLDATRLPVVLTAKYRGHQDVVDVLVEAGAELYIWEGAALGRLDIVQRDVKRWPEIIDEHGRDGFMPLQLACFFNHEEIALWLIEQGADVNVVAQNTQKISAVHAAAAGGNLTILKALLDHGADANARQQNDFVPLHTAAENGNRAMAEMLLAFGADPEAVTEDGRAPRDIARDKGHDEIAALLV